MSDPSEQQILPAPGPKGAIHQVAAAEIDQQVATARRFPRDAIKAKADSMAIATRNQETATACFYLLKRGTKRIIGPSIRLAEILCQNWGNLRCDTRIEEIGRTRLTAASAVWDLERNVLVIMRSQRGITYSHGGRYNEDMITTTANAAASIAFRNAVFKLIPPDITEAIFQKCQDVSAGSAESLADNRVKMVKAFGAIDVPLDVILNEFGAEALEDLGRQEMLFLRAAYTSITKEGMDATSVFVGRQKEKGAQASQAGDPAAAPASQGSHGDSTSEPPSKEQKAAHRSEGDAPNAADIIANAQADPSKADTPRVYDSSREYAWKGVNADGEEVSGTMEAPGADVVYAVLEEERSIKQIEVTLVELREYHWTGIDQEGKKVSGKLKARDASVVPGALQDKFGITVQAVSEDEIDPEADGDQDAEPTGPAGDYDWTTSIIPAGDHHDERAVVWSVLMAKERSKHVIEHAVDRANLVVALEIMADHVARLGLDKKRLQLTFTSAPDSYDAPEAIVGLLEWVNVRLAKKKVNAPAAPAE